MSHGFELEPAKGPAKPDNRALAAVSLLLDRFNIMLMRLSMVAIVLTAAVLTYSVAVRYFFKAPTDWQDDVVIFMLVGVTFFCTPYVQSYRGHIGIDALSSLLSPRVNAIRLFLVDVISLIFCAFFSWKSWTMFREAYVDHHTTGSTLELPLSIPYAMMALGMSILTFQILIQVLTHLTNKRGAP
ncbi:MAG: TRAP transporter small permease [Massilia sp.]